MTTTAVAVTTVAATAAEEGSGGGGAESAEGWMCWVLSDGGCHKIAKAIWRFHPTARRHVFDAVLKHRWPSTPCHGANMAGKKN